MFAWKAKAAPLNRESHAFVCRFVVVFQPVDLLRSEALNLVLTKVSEPEIVFDVPVHVLAKYNFHRAANRLHPGGQIHARSKNVEDALGTAPVSGQNEMVLLYTCAAVAGSAGA